MYTIIRPGGVVYRRMHKKRNQSGFTLPEVLVSLCIVGMLLQGVWQWGLVMQQTAKQMAENDLALYYAQAAFVGQMPQCPEDWYMAVESAPVGELLEAVTVTVHAPSRAWTFYQIVPKA